MKFSTYNLRLILPYFFVNFIIEIHCNRIADAYLSPKRGGKSLNSVLNILANSIIE